MNNKHGDALLVITEILIEPDREANAQEMASFAGMSDRMVRYELQKLTADKWITKHGAKYQLSRKGRKELAEVSQELGENPHFEKVVELMAGEFAKKRNPAHRPLKSISERKDLISRETFPSGKAFSTANPHGSASERSLDNPKQLNKLDLQKRVKELQERIKQLEETNEDLRHRIEDLEDRLYDCMTV